MKKLTTNEFIEKAKKIHGDKYDYNKVDYINNRTKICIICKEHGEFWQTPNKHLLGQGCPECGNTMISLVKRSNSSEFIEKSRKIHGDKYDYSNVKYTNAKTKVCIICPIHGEFWQLPDDHLCGKECPICKSSKLEKSVRKFLIENKIDYIHKKHFEWLGQQHLDFYLPKYNIAIECQGGQHFKPIEHFGGINDFNKTILRDMTKKKLCESNNLILLYYSELEIDFPYEVITSKNNLLKIIKNYEK